MSAKGYQSVYVSGSTAWVPGTKQIVLLKANRRDLILNSKATLKNAVPR